MPDGDYAGFVAREVAAGRGGAAAAGSPVGPIVDEAGRASARTKAWRASRWGSARVSVSRPRSRSTSPRSSPATNTVRVGPEAALYCDARRASPASIGCRPRRPRPGEPVEAQIRYRHAPGRRRGCSSTSPGARAPRVRRARSGRSRPASRWRSTAGTACSAGPGLRDPYPDDAALVAALRADERASLARLPRPLREADLLRSPAHGPRRGRRGRRLPGRARGVPARPAAPARAAHDPALAHAHRVPPGARAPHAPPARADPAGSRGPRARRPTPDDVAELFARAEDATRVRAAGRARRPGGAPSCSACCSSPIPRPATRRSRGASACRSARWARRANAASTSCSTSRRPNPPEHVSGDRLAPP